MKIKLYPSVVSGAITPPPSKSFLHRSIISACLAEGVSQINNVIYSKDIEATLNAFESLGVKIQRDSNKIQIDSLGYHSFLDNVNVNCNESGSTLRFIIPILSNSKYAYFKGKSSLINRPMDIYEDLFHSQGLEFKKSDNSIITKGRISSGNFEVPGNISSQFISGLLFILPLLKGDSTIKITSNFESSSYVDMTVSILSNFGINIEIFDNVFFIKGNQKYVPTNVYVESDFSQLAFYAVLGIVNNDLKINNINFNSLQPDRKILDFIEKMGGRITKSYDSAHIHKSNTFGITIDVSQCPDIGPILGVLAAHSKGTTDIINAKRLIIKESNRLLSTFEILKSFGISVSMGEDSLTILGSDKFVGNDFDSFNDHRIAMSIAIAATIADGPVIIDRAEAVQKSYPSFYEDLASIGVRIEYL